MKQKHQTIECNLRCWKLKKQLDTLRFGTGTRKWAKMENDFRLSFICHVHIQPYRYRYITNNHFDEIIVGNTK